MAQMLRIAPQQASFDTRLPARPSGSGIGAIGEALGQVGQVFGKIQEAEDVSSAQRAVADTQAKIKQTIVLNDQKFSDPDEYLGTRDEIKSIYDGSFESLKSPKARKLFADAMSNDLINAETSVQQVVHQKKIKIAKTNIEESGKTYLQSAANAANDEERKSIVQGYENFLGYMAGLGVISKDEGVKIATNFKENLEKEVASLALFYKPESLLKGLEDPTFLPRLNFKERVIYQQQAQVAIRAKAIEAERQKQEAIDKANSQLLIESESLVGNEQAMLKFADRVRRDDKLPFAVKKSWTDRINATVANLIKGKADPLQTDDQLVRAHVVKGILSDPDKWSADDIINYMGQGLSINSVIRYTDLLKTQQKQDKESPEKKSQFTQMRKQWEEYRRGQFFLTEDERKTASSRELSEDGTMYLRMKDPALNLKNDRIANDLWDRFMEETKPVSEGGQGRDPNKAMQALMAPYWDKTVKSWGQFIYDRLTIGSNASNFVEPSKEEVAARQAAILAGEEPTPENVKKQMDILGVKRKPINDGVKKETFGKWNKETDWPILKDVFRKSTGVDLPVSAEGQSATHDKLDFDHSSSVDVAIHPDSNLGKKLIGILKERQIPFIEFRGMVPGQSTGAHIHIGRPSPRKKK